MAQEHPAKVVEWRHIVEGLADRFGAEVYRTVAGIAVAASTVEAVAATGGPDVRTATAAIRQVSAGLHRIAAITGGLRRSVDQAIRQMIADSKSTRTDATSGSADSVNRLVQAVFLAREIDSLATDIAGLGNLLAAPLSHVAPSAGSDLAAAAGRIATLAARAVPATDEIGARLAELQQHVSAALAGPHAGDHGLQARPRAA
ncbi:hypothetical protein [Thalassobaculum sp.]|uniref:hypothetical protein n=1 Tax=Thalassobaculum sp. TaxID=2022740 RepID=UPI0032ED7B6F